MTSLYEKIFISIFMSLCLIISSSNIVMAYEEDDFDDIRRGRLVFSCARLSCAPLSDYNLTKAYFSYTYFCGSLFQRTICERATFACCDFYGADFESANLTNTSFWGSILLYVNLKNTVVSGANFKDVVGLTNKQKEYLRKNGAINVPENLSPEEFEKELKLIAEFREDWVLKKIKKICARLFCCCTKKDKS